MLTLNQIKQRLIGFFTEHAQINDVKYENDFAFNAERELTYPVANIDYLESNINNKVIGHRYQITLGDLTSPDVKGIDDEILSDMLLIAEDFCTFLQYDEGWQFDKSVNIQKFLDDTHDRVSGITFRITINTIRSQNECSIPKLVSVS